MSAWGWYMGLTVGGIRGRFYGYRNTFDVANYGAVPGVDSTVAIQAALDAANSAGGGIVAITVPGTYTLSLNDASLFSALTIGSNTGLFIGPGVTLKRSAGSRCYILRNKAQSAGNTNIWIGGGGTIDGNAKWIALDGTYTHSSKTFTFTVTGMPAGEYSFTSGDTLDVTAITGGGSSATNTITINSATNNGTTLTIVTATSPTGASGDGTAVDVRINRCSTATADATAGWLGQGILLQNCTDTHVEDLTFKHECKFAVWFAGGQRFSAERLHMFTASDGVHIEGTGQAVTGMSTPLTSTTEFVVRDITGWCGDNKVAIGTDEGTYYTPNGGPFSKGDVTDGLIENIQCENDWEPIRFFGSASAREVSRIVTRNLHGTVRRGQGYKLAVDANGLPGATHKRMVLENFNLTCSQSGSCPVYIESPNIEDLTIRGLNSFQTTNTAALVYCVSSGLKSLTIEGGTVGTSSAGYQGKIVELGVANTNVQKIIIRDMYGWLNSARCILVNHASAKIDALVDGCRFVYNGGNGGDIQIFDLISTNAGGNWMRMVGCTLDGLVSGGTNGTILKNQITAASATTNYLTLIGNDINDWEAVVVVANDADCQTVVRAFGNTISNLGAFASGPLSGGAVQSVGASVGLLRFVCPDVSIDGTWTRGTQVAGDRFINTSAAASGGSPSTNWGTLGSKAVIYDGTAWQLD